MHQLRGLASQSAASVRHLRSHYCERIVQAVGAVEALEWLVRLLNRGVVRDIYALDIDVAVAECRVRQSISELEARSDVVRAEPAVVDQC